MNITSELYQEMYQDIPLKVTLSALCLTLVLSSPLLLGIAHFEKFGGDPQKRCIGNKLISYAIPCMFINQNMNNLTLLIRFVFGCLHVVHGYLYLVVGCFLSFSVYGFILELMVYKMMQVFAHGFALRLDDDYWSHFLLIWTFSASGTILHASHTVGYLDDTLTKNEYIDMLICRRTDTTKPRSM